MKDECFPHRAPGPADGGQRGRPARCRHDLLTSIRSRLEAAHPCGSVVVGIQAARWGRDTPCIRVVIPHFSRSVVWKYRCAAAEQAFAKQTDITIIIIMSAAIWAQAILAQGCLGPSEVGGALCFRFSPSRPSLPSGLSVLLPPCMLRPALCLLPFRRSPASCPSFRLCRPCLLCVCPPGCLSLLSPLARPWCHGCRVPEIGCEDGRAGRV